MQSQPLSARKLRLTTSYRVPSPSPEYIMDAYMTSHLEVRLGTCVKGWVKQKKLDPTLNTSHVNIFAKNNQDPTLMIMNRILTVL